MMSGKLRYWLLLMCMFTLSAVNAQSLTERINRIVNEEGVAQGHAGVYVYNLTQGNTIYSWQADKLFRPASTMKLLTTVAALDKLGLSATVDTELYYTGTIENGTLYGNVYVKGGMDPLFGEAELNALVDQIKGWGISCIAGKLVMDDSMKEDRYWAPGWCWEDGEFDYQPEINALELNGGCVEIQVTPGERGEKALVTLVPQTAYCEVINETESRTPAAGKLIVERNWMRGGNTIKLSGNVGTVVRKKVPMANEPLFFAETLVGKLQEAGIKCHEIGLDKTPLEYAKRETISRGIGEIVQETLKESYNLGAESLLFNMAEKTLGSEKITWEEAAGVLKQFVTDSLRCEADNYIVMDGSGLSTYDLLSPKLLVTCLEYAYGKKVLFDVLYNALPIAGVDGTLKTRMRQTGVRNKVRAKTGTVTAVSSLAGYARALNGDWLAFAIMNNHVKETSVSRNFQDRICAEIIK